MPDTDKPFTEQYLMDRWIDATKTACTANSAGLFGCGVALYYFGTKPFPVPLLLKCAALTFLVGVLAFVVSYISLNRHLMVHDPVFAPYVNQAKDTPQVLKLRASSFTAAAVALWLIATAISAIAIVNL